MGKKKKSKSLILKIIYAICAVIVFIAGLYYENGYKDIDTFINDLSSNISKISGTITESENPTSSNENIQNNNITQIPTKSVNGTLQMHLIDVGQRR